MSKPNGHKRRKTSRARYKILRYARRRGSISNAEARKIGRWKQEWFHLNAMVDAGALRYGGYNCWLPTKRKQRDLYL